MTKTALAQIRHVLTLSCIVPTSNGSFHGRQFLIMSPALHSSALTAFSPRMRGVHFLLFVSGLLFAGCTGPRSSNNEAVPALSELAPAPYVRVLNTGSNQVQLQI